MPTNTKTYEEMLAVAIEQARYGRMEGGIPIGAAMFRKSGELISTSIASSEISNRGGALHSVCRVSR